MNPKDLNNKRIAPFFTFLRSHKIKKERFMICLQTHRPWSIIYSMWIPVNQDEALNLNTGKAHHEKSMKSEIKSGPVWNTSVICYCLDFSSREQMRTDSTLCPQRYPQHGLEMHFSLPRHEAALSLLFKRHLLALWTLTLLPCALTAAL